MPQEPSQSISAVGLSAAQEAAKARRKLTEQGRKLIQDYVDSVHGHGRKLTLEERKDLLRQVKGLPGCASYGLQNLTLWLQNHQYINKPYRDKTEPSRSSSLSTLPTLTPPMRAQLAALLALEADAGTDPAPAKVALWAGMLAPAGAARDEVLAYVRLQLDYAGIKRRQAQRLPTPTSPTPSSASPMATVVPVSAVASPASPVVAAPVVAYTGAHDYAGPPLRKPALPTRLGAKAPPLTPGYPSPAPDTDADDMSISPEASRMPMPASALPPSALPALRASILQGVADAVSAPPPALPAGMPSTPAEFHALFAAYEAPLAQILSALEA